MTTQSKTATEQQGSKKNDSKHQTTGLDNRYGKIGISAVAAAVRHKGAQQTVNAYRIPYDRD